MEDVETLQPRMTFRGGLKNSQPRLRGWPTYVGRILPHGSKDEHDWHHGVTTTQASLALAESILADF